MDGLAIDIERCPDGVELIDMPTRMDGLGKPVSAGLFFRYRTDRLESHQIEIADLGDPVVIAFVNATDDKQRQLFFGRFGLDTRYSRHLWGEPFEPPLDWVTGIRRDNVLNHQSQLKALLRRAGGDDRAAAMAAVNSAIASRSGFNLRPTFHLAGARGAPRLLLKSESLLGFMLLETAMIVAHGARVAECEKCGDFFLTGPLTGRRSHARFCSDRCRVAAMRARNAEIKVGE